MRMFYGARSGLGWRNLERAVKEFKLAFSLDEALRWI